MDVKKVLRVARHALVWGPWGVGKTRLGQEVCGEDALQVYINEDVSTQELFGHYVPEGAQFRWHDGPLTDAFRLGKGVVVNELHKASSEVLVAMLGLLDDPLVAKLTLPTGETVRVREGFKVVATSNEPPDVLDEALVDRFDAIVEIKAPMSGVIAAIRMMDDAMATVIQNSYEDPSRAISPRRAFAWHRMKKSGLTSKQALEAAFGDQAQDVGMALKALTTEWTETLTDEEEI